MLYCSKKIAVLIITHNRLAFLKKSVDSVLASNSNKFELYVFNYASDDGTNEYLQSINDKRLIGIRRNINLGSFENANDVLETINAEYCVFLHDDDTISKNHLDMMFDLIEKDPEISIIGSDWNVINEKDEVILTNKYKEFKSSIILDDKKYFWHHLKGLNFPWSGSMMRMSKIQDLRFEGGKYPFIADAVFMAKLAVGNKVGYIPGTLINYRIYREQTSKNISFNQQIEMWENNFNFYINLINKNHFREKYLLQHKKATSKTFGGLIINSPDKNYFFKLFKSKYFNFFF